MSDIKIDDIRRQLEDIGVKSHLNDRQQTDKTGAGSGQRFSDILKNAVDGVNDDQLKGQQAIKDFMSGKETSLHNTLLSLEKAEISFKLMMQVRGKLMEAYQQIMRTSV